MSDCKHGEVQIIPGHLGIRCNVCGQEARFTLTQPALTVERPMKWNQDKPHRCPSCHTVAVPGSVGRPQRGVVYTCCRCNARFSSSPSRRKMPERGVVCAHHVPATCRPGGERP